MDKGASIARFLELHHLGVIGVSRTGKNFGASLYRELVKRYSVVVPVNRNGGSIDGVAMTTSIGELEGRVDGIVVAVPPEECAIVVQEAYAAGIRNIWIQQRSESADAITFCSEHHLAETHGECLMMYLSEVSFPHRLHRAVRRLAGRLPHVPGKVM